MTIANRLYAGFAFILLLLAITTIIGTYQVGEIDKTLVRVNEVGSEKQRFAINYRGSVHDRAIALRDLVLVERASERPPLRELIAKLKNDYAESQQGMQRIISDEQLVNSEEKSLLAAIAQIREQGLESAAEVERLLQSDQRQQAQDYVIRELGPIYAEWLNRINDFIDYQEASISKGTQGVMERSENFATLMWWITAFAIIAGGLVAWRIVVRLTHRIGGEPEEAAQLADDTDKETVNGSREVEATVRSIEELAKQVESASAVIGELSDNTAEINKVLEVIEGIADQTNLLALNAAIEAARAGEHGRGFSVVADEVRALANRTQDSTRSIQSLIETMRGSATNAVDVMEQGREKAAQSVEQARRAGESLQSVNTSVAKMSDMNAQIATAAEEQTAVAEEINQNFTSITEAAEQAAAGSEQISEASRELQELAKRLNNGMKRFKIA